MDLKSKIDNFMWYVLFGTDVETAKEDAKTKEGKKRIIKTLALKAYRDLSRTLSYSFSSGKLEEMKRGKHGEENAEEKRKAVSFDEVKERFKEEVICTITNSILSLPEMLKLGRFNKWHEETCKDIRNKADKIVDGKIYLFTKKNKKGEDVKGKEAFFYGQAQKWLNMTLKNVLILSMLNDELKLIDYPIKSIVQYLHVPVDSLIMQGAAKELEIKVTSKPWSQWTKCEYVAFQDNIRKKFPPENRDLELEIKGIPYKYSCPIEWEFDAWIRMSESRS